MNAENPVYSQILNELHQSHETRHALIDKLERDLGRRIITFFTSSLHPVAINDTDNDMIEDVLQCDKTFAPITLVLNSPGGSALAAERIINTCRTYSKGDFEVIVPRMAKSAATVICMGANKIWMNRTAELGPIDPQVVIRTHDGNLELRAAYYIVESYESLFKEAVGTKGNKEPYLQQLDRYDARDIREYKKIMELSVEIAIKSLKSGVMCKKTEEEIKKLIGPFTDPEKTKTHGRPITLDEVKAAGLPVNELDISTDQWSCLWELYLRSNRFVNSEHGSKLCESLKDSFHVPIPK